MVNVYGFIDKNGEIIKPLTTEYEKEMKENFPWEADANGEWKDGFWDGDEIPASEYVIDVDAE